MSRIDRAALTIVYLYRLIPGAAVTLLLAWCTVRLIAQREWTGTCFAAGLTLALGWFTWRRFQRLSVALQPEIDSAP